MVFISQSRSDETSWVTSNAMLRTSGVVRAANMLEGAEPLNEFNKDKEDTRQLAPQPYQTRLSKNFLMTDDFFWQI